jgi:hypothetical protein
MTPGGWEPRNTRTSKGFGLGKLHVGFCGPHSLRGSQFVSTAISKLKTKKAQLDTVIKRQRNWHLEDA